MLKLVTSEGLTIEVEKSLTAKSELINRMLQANELSESINLPEITHERLEKVLEFCRHYKELKYLPIQSPLRSNRFEELIPAWDAAFINIDQSELLDLILSANYFTNQRIN